VNETAQSRPADHAAVHRAVVDRIVAEIRPVRRLWPVWARLAVWIVLEIGVLVGLILHGHRPDLAGRLQNPAYLFTVGIFAVCGIIAATLALRAAIPGREPRPIEVTALIVLGTVAALLLFSWPLNDALPLSDFISTGVHCAAWTVIFALAPWIALLWALGRGAPMAGAFDGALAGAAAFLCSFALMRVDCPIDEPLHLLTWHLAPALAGIALSAGIGVVLLRRRVGK